MFNGVVAVPSDLNGMGALYFFALLALHSARARRSRAPEINARDWAECTCWWR